MSEVARGGQVVRGPAISCVIGFLSSKKRSALNLMLRKAACLSQCLPLPPKRLYRGSFQMEDEESGMALNFQSTRGQKRNSSKLPAQDTVVKRPRRHQITARIGCAVMFLLIGALIAHRIWAFQMRQPVNDAKKPNVSLVTL
uniref:Uncharacterized protein n=1 Tax=Sphaerodactylus townsendi TaxID=933632 RepID=A0ACB8EGL4_9SAUR